MIRLAAAALVVLAGAPQDSAPPPPDLVFAQVTVRQQVIIRVPRSRQQRVEAGSPMNWREGAGPRCIRARQIARAMPAPSSVDFVLQDNRRIRAHLGRRCAGLDYYDGLYFNANPDGQICADRDIIRSRMGGQCGIVQFRSLEAVRP